MVRWLRGRYAPCNMYMSARCVKVGLRFSPDLFRCDSCGLQFLQSGNNYYDLLPHHLLENKGNQWRERQQEMEERNKDLIASPLPRIIAWIRLHPLCLLLATLFGDVLDVGGERRALFATIFPATLHRRWLGEYNCEVKMRGCGVRIVSYLLPSTVRG